MLMLPMPIIERYDDSEDIKILSSLQKEPLLLGSVSQ